MRYFCITHQPVDWPVPEYMELVSTVPAGEAVSDLGQRYPELAGRGRVLGEYATLFGVRRLLQEEWGADGASADAMVGLAQYRRFPVTTPTGTPSAFWGMVHPDEFAALPGDLFQPDPGQVLIPMPAQFDVTIIGQYAAAHVARDLLHFMGLAVDLGVVSDQEVAAFLGGRVMVPGCAVGVYPAGWLVTALESIEKVVDAFEATVVVPREGYQRRAVGFCCERLQSLLIASLLATLPSERVLACRSLMISDTRVYQLGA